MGSFLCLSFPAVPQALLLPSGDSVVSLCTERGRGGSPCLLENGCSSSSREGGRRGLYQHNTDEKLSLQYFFQAMKDPPAALGYHLSMPRVVGMSAVDTVLG